MHESVREWVDEIVTLEGIGPDLFVVELGSYNVNGSVRDLFGPDYLGIDMRPGPGVDRVANAWDTGVSAGTVDVIVCTEMLEHCEKVAETFEEIHRILRPGGDLLLTTRSPGYPLHEYPSDYFRFTKGDLIAWLAFAGIHCLEAVDDPQAPGAFVYGKKTLSERGPVPTQITPAPSS